MAGLKPSKSRNAKPDFTSKGIVVIGARENNLKSIDTFIPRHQITVVTGLSGSGKSSLVFDTIYAEGQRRYVESLSSYARFFMDKIKKPELDSISGLSACIAIDQRSLTSSLRSTVGTVTEVYDYLRLLFARLGTPYCTEHGEALESFSIDRMVEGIMRKKKGVQFSVLAPIAKGKKGEFLKEFDLLLSAGYDRVRINGKWVELPYREKLSKRKDHFIDVLVDRLVVESNSKVRLKESLEKASNFTGGEVKIEWIKSQGIDYYSLHATCPVCSKGFPKLEPKMFSFNNPKGACTECNGLGYFVQEGGEEYFVEREGEYYGANYIQCSVCKGARLKPFSLSVKIAKKNIAELSHMSIEELSQFCSGLFFPERYKLVADKILEKVCFDLSVLKKIGLSYLSLDRPTYTLSGGEAQRTRLMSQISSPLIGVLYTLDEPSVGLHPFDHHRLLKILFEIRDRGNTVLVVEHDEKTIVSADHIIDIGPLAGKCGGSVIVEGSVKKVMRTKKSLTGQYLSGKKIIPLPASRSKGTGNFLEIKGAAGNNLKNINVQIPLGCLVGVTGVSGSGKSTLVIETIYKALMLHLHQYSFVQPAKFGAVKGLEFLDKVVSVNQKPIGRTPRSIPATYVGIMSMIRSLMSQIPLARVRGYAPGHFSFNVKGGRCETCSGTGQIKQEMFFLASATLLCDVCQGRRYSNEILHVQYKRKNIYEILGMNISEASQFFAHHSRMKRQLDLLKEVGLGYLNLGQNSMTLSGGEAQRIKLTRELSKKNTNRTLYILDEPTTGLHFEDVKQLIFVLRKLTKKGSTVIVIEHQMDVIKSCDYLIDLGPGGGFSGGEVVAIGSPEKVARSKRSQTATFLKRALEKRVSSADNFIG